MIRYTPTKNTAIQRITFAFVSGPVFGVESNTCSFAVNLLADLTPPAARFLPVTLPDVLVTLVPLPCVLLEDAFVVPLSAGVAGSSVVPGSLGVGPSLGYGSSFTPGSSVPFGSAGLSGESSNSYV